MNKKLLDFLQKYTFFIQINTASEKTSNSETARIDIITEIQLQLDKKNKCVIVSLGLCEAFDTVDHKILLSEMYDAGIRASAYNWFSDYLHNRYQVVYTNNESSSKKRIFVAFRKD